MGTCLSIHNSSLDSHVARLEADMPWTNIAYATYEERVKRLVFEEDHEQISLAVLIKSFEGSR